MTDFETLLRESLAEASAAVTPDPGALTKYRRTRSKRQRFAGGNLPVVAAVIATMAVIGGVLGFVFSDSGSG